MLYLRGVALSLFNTNYVFADSDVILSEGSRLTCTDFIDEFKIESNIKEGKNANLEVQYEPNGCSYLLTGECKSTATCSDFKEDFEVTNSITNSENGEFTGFKVTKDSEGCGVTVSGQCKSKATCSDFINKVTVALPSEFNLKDYDVIKKDCSISYKKKAPKCSYYKGTVTATNKDSIASITIRDVSYDKTTASCLEGILNGYYSDGCDDIAHKGGADYRVGVLGSYADAVFYGDDCVVKKIENNFSLTCKDRRSHTDVCVDGYFYFDKECNSVSAENVSNLCDNIPNVDITFEWSTPISLIWSKGHDINSDVVFANFNLDLANTENSWSAWKASAEAPLLVYDPTHSGEVKDATQLFGDWTFGGKQLASLMSADVEAGKWDNGYEALATLDRDFDGKLSGEELNDLALWFDVNRDAVSQKGEVKSLKEVAVKTLFFKGYNKDSHGDLRLAVGYEREVDGELISGESVDWYEIGAESKQGLIDYIHSLGKSQSEEPKLDMLVESENILKNIKDSKFNGLWNWTINEKDAVEESPSKGTFIFSATGNNKVQGYTFTERFFERSPNNQLNSFVTLNRVEGIENGNTLEFTAKVGNSYTKNKAVLSADGKTVDGSTTVFVDNAKTITYSWKAERRTITK